MLHQRLEHLYKFRAVFKGELAPGIAAPYSTSHSMLANLILDYPKVDNELDIISNLRENYLKIIQFSNSDSIENLKLYNCDLKYGRQYKEMLKHILISDKNLPQNIDANSIIKGKDNLVYSISKRKRG